MRDVMKSAMQCMLVSQKNPLLQGLVNIGDLA